jgi:hypothetical protein
MTTKNDITGDLLKSKPSTKQYEDNYDRIFKQNRVGGITIATNQPVDSSENWDEERMDIVGQNGNVGYDLDATYQEVEKDYGDKS